MFAKRRLLFFISEKGGSEDGGYDRKRTVTVLIDKYTDLQRIKRANNGVENQELEYQIKVTIAKLASLGVSVEDITL